MFRVSLKNVTGRFWTLVLTALAVVTGTAFVAGALVFTDSIDRTFSELFDSSGASTDVVVRGVEGAGSTGFGDGRSPLPISLAEDIAEVDGVERATPSLFGSALLVGADGTAVLNSNAPSFGTGYDENDSMQVVVAGRAPENADEIAVESVTLESSGLAVGDTTQIVAGPEPADVTIVGEIESEGNFGATLIYFDAETAAGYFAPDDTVSSFFVVGDGSLSRPELADAVGDVVPDTAEAVTQDVVTDENQEMLGTALGFVNTFLFVFGAVALLVGAFIIGNVFSMLLARRTRELALLRAVGASAGQVLSAVLAEAVVVGLVGSALGLGVGVLIAFGLRTAVGAFGFELSGDLPVGATTVIVTLAVGLIVTVLSALLPAIRASRVAPVAAMRDDVALGEGAIRGRAIAGVVLAAVGVAALLVGLFADVTGPLYWVGAGVLATFFGVAIAAPAIARPVIWLISAPSVALLGTVGRLARQNSLRNPRRTAATASALMIGTALVGAAAIVTSSINASLAESVENDLLADYVLTAGQTSFVPPGVAEQVAGLDDVELSLPVRAVQLQVLPDGAPAEPTPGQPVEGAVDLLALGASLPELARIAALDVTAGSTDTDAADSIALARSAADDNGWEVGDVVTALAGTAPAQDFTVTAIYEDATIPGSAAIVPTAVYEAGTPEGQRADQQIFVLATEGADLGALKTSLTTIVRPYLIVSVLDGDEFVTQATSAVSQILLFITLLLGLSIGVALVGIVITLVLSVIERRREIGLLRAVGLTQVQLRRTVTLEGVATSVFGALLGITLGVVFGLALQRALSDGGLDTLSVPYVTLILFLVAGVVVGVLASAAPAWWASKRNVLESIATE